MGKKIGKYIFLALEMALMITIIVFQTLTITVNDDLVKNTPNIYPIVKWLYIISTLLAFIFSLICGIYSIKKTHIPAKERTHVLVIYLFVNLIADIFFNTLGTLAGFIVFIFSYLLIGIMIFRKKYELIIRGVAYVILVALALIIPKARNSLGIIGSIILATLLSNIVILLVQYAKTKDKSILILLISQFLALLSDLSMVGRSQLSNEIASNVFGYIVWITYILANSLIALAYVNKLNILRGKIHEQNQD